MKYKIRTLKGTAVVNLTRRTAIKFFCKECMGFNETEVSGCTSPLCPLYPFRNNKAISKSSERKPNPNALEALAKARQKRKFKIGD